MEFSYFDDSNKLKKINIKIGTEWSKLKINHTALNSIFQKVDDGDKKVSEKEFGALQYIFSLADKYIKKSANNNILENEELENVIKKIDDKTINTNDLKNSRIDKICSDDYTLESIKKRYPQDKYEITTNSPYINVYDKKTKNLVLNVLNNEAIIIINENPYTDKESSRLYKKTGENANLEEYTLEGKKHVVLADDIYKEISAKNRFGLATTGKNLEKYVMKLNKDNILKVMWSYKSCYGETLDEAIKGEILLDKNVKNRLTSHIKKCLEKAYGYEPNFHIEDSALTNNKKWRGNYSLDGNANRIIIKNKKNGKTRTLDLNKLTKDLPIEAQIQIKQRIQNWPPESLMDLAIEVDSLKTANFIDKLMNSNSIQALYSPGSDSITVDVSSDPDIESALLHELGHAIDYNGKFFNTASTNSNNAFKSAFKKELDAYIKAGNKRFEDGDSLTGNYATKDEQEMFAECYCELVGAGSQSGKIIHKYFPETLKAVNRLLEEIRSMPDNERHDT